MIVDDPTDEDVSKILELMVLRPVKYLRLLNRVERLATRGTPGEVIPQYEVTFGVLPMFYGDFEGLDDESWIINRADVERMHNGATIVYKVAKATPEFDDNGFHRIKDEYGQTVGIFRSTRI